jgi:hypothetical protein
MSNPTFNHIEIQGGPWGFGQILLRGVLGVVKKSRRSPFSSFIAFLYPNLLDHTPLLPYPCPIPHWTFIVFDIFHLRAGLYREKISKNFRQFPVPSVSSNMELKLEGELLDRFEGLRVRFQKFKISATEANQLCQDVKIILPDITRLHQFHLGDTINYKFSK